MKKKTILIILIVMIFLGIGVGILNTRYKDNKEKEDNKRNEMKLKLKEKQTIKEHKKRLAKKYNIAEDEIECISFRGEHTEKRGVGVWFETVDVTVRDFGKYKYKDKVITVFGERDDFYYDELIEAVENYYCKLLGVDRIIVGTNDITTEYCSFFNDNDVKKIDDDVVRKFIKDMNNHKSVIRNKKKID